MWAIIFRIISAWHTFSGPGDVVLSNIQKNFFKTELEDLPQSRRVTVCDSNVTHVTFLEYVKAMLLGLLWLVRKMSTLL